MSEGQGGYGPLEFTTRVGWLAQLAKWAVTAVPSSTTLPINGCFKVTVRTGHLEVAAADQAKAVLAVTPMVSTQHEGEVFLPARKLEAILGAAPDGDVTVSVKGFTALVTAGSASWSLRLYPPDRHIGLPDLSGAQFASFDREKLLAALAAVKHAVGRDSGRPAFTQVRIAESGGAMYATAAGSSQFSQAPAPGFPAPLCVPGSVLDDLVKLLKTPAEVAEVASHGSYAVFRVGPVTLAALKVAQVFPDVDSSFLGPARGNDQKLEVDKAELAGALRRVRVNADASTSAVALVAGGGGGLTVTSRDTDGNGAEQVIPAKWDGGHQVLTVNAGFLADMLAAHPAATCEFKVGKSRGKVLPPLLLEDTEAGVTGICTQMVSKLVGYEKEK